MYDEIVQDIDEMAEALDLTALVPASNTIIVKEAAEDPIMMRYIELTESLEDNVSVTWTNDTAEITVSNA